MNKKITQILEWYRGQNPGVLTNLSRLLNAGALEGTGKLVILPVDQGFEHGPERSFGPNEAAYDPTYHFRLAIKAGLSALAGPLGLLECGAAEFAGQIPLILKMNHSNLLNSQGPTQAIVANIEDALRLGCIGIGFTVYPGSDCYIDMLEQLQKLASRAKKFGLIVVVWSYPRGALKKESETALDVITYAAHMAALIGAHIIKVKLPSNSLDAGDATLKYLSRKDELKNRVEYVKRACFVGKRLVVFSGGATKSETSLLEEVRAIKLGGGDGSIVGRNAFQRPESEALEMLGKIMEIYKN